MDNSIESRINKSLMIHNLDNLVYEKRQRKTVPQVSQLLFNKPQVHKVKHKKKASKEPPAKNESKEKNEKQQKKKRKTKTRKIERKSKIQQMNTRVENKKNERAKEVQSPSISPRKNKEKEEKSTPKNRNENVQQNKFGKQVCKNPGETQKKLDSHNQLFQNAKDKNIRQVLQEESPYEYSEQDREGEKIKKINDNQKPKRSRGRPKKLKEEPPVEVILKEEEDVEVVSEVCQVQEAAQLEKSVTVEKINEPEALPQALEPAQIVNSDYMAASRSRRAKFNPMIRYNQNDDEMNSDESFQTERDARRKKKISKNRNRYRSNQPYNLNRIFRKEAKKNFACFQIQVDLNNLLLQDFVKQFGVFDLIHFSLPLQFLHLFPSIPAMMDKGFVFLWVEQKETQLGYHLLNRWGFDVIDQIIWIKCNQEEGKIQADNVNPAFLITDSEDTTKDIFVNMKSTCLVGYKCPIGNKAEYRTKISNNIIFSKAGRGCSKPSEIYEIADLMMPGGKKLQFGGSSKKGWLNIKHNQTTLNRCHQCFREGQLYILHNKQQSSFIQCQRCIIDNIRQLKQSQSLDLQAIKKQFNELPKTKITQVSYMQNNCIIRCSRCETDKDQVGSAGFIKPSCSLQVFCSKCFRETGQTIEDQTTAEVITKKKCFYNSASIKCSQCEVEIMHDKYFECSKNKNVKICQKCFWKTEISADDGSTQKDKRPLPKTTPEWKLKFIKNSPLMKFSCFGCKRDLSLPFWSCETCQSWSWCGLCDKGSSQIHPHYQSSGHKEYLMI